MHRVGRSSLDEARTAPACPGFIVFRSDSGQPTAISSQQSAHRKNGRGSSSPPKLRALWRVREGRAFERGTVIGALRTPDQAGGGMGEDGVRPALDPAQRTRTATMMTPVAMRSTNSHDGITLTEKVPGEEKMLSFEAPSTAFTLQ